MLLALVNLDNGLFLDEKGWTHLTRLAQKFRNSEAVAAAASGRDVKNAAAVILLGDDFRPGGFIWVTKPTTSI